jgi:hypothetical protein
MTEPTGTSIPVPDPSTLTTAQLLREIEILRGSIDDKVEARQREMLVAQELSEAKLHGEIELTAQRFNSFEALLELKELQRVEQKSDTKAAVDAALIAQKEAVQEQTIASGLSIAKSEAATAKQLDQQSVTFTTAISGVTKTSSDQKDAFNISIGDLKERLSALDLKVGSIESTKQGAREQTTERRAGNSQVIAIAALAASLLAGVFTAVLIKLFGG